MPILALDKNGRLYQTEGLENSDLGVGYYADDSLGEQRSVYFGDTSPEAERKMHAQKNKKMLEEKKRREQIQRQQKQMILEKQKVNARKMAQEKISRQHQTARSLKTREKYMKAVRDSKDPMNQIESQFMGNPMWGFEQKGTPLMNSEAMNGAILAGDYKISEGFGNTMLGESDGGMAGWGALGKLVKGVAKVAGKAVKVANPVTLVKNVATQLPVVKDVYKGVDKLTGGTLTSIVKVSEMPARALDGQKLSKAEFMEAGMMLLKVGAIAATGGSATALIGAGAGALKGGPLGKTSFGRNLLSVAEIGSLASIGGTSISKVLEKKATEMASSYASSEVGKRTGVLGSIAAGAAVSAGFAGVSGGGDNTIKAGANVTNTVAKNSEVAGQKAAEELAKQAKSGAIKFSNQAAFDAAKTEVSKAAKKAVSKEFEKKTGVPLDFATRIAKGDVPSSQEIKASVETKIHDGIDNAKAELARTMSQIPTSEAGFKKVLEQKQLHLEQAIKNKVAVVEAVKEDSAKTLLTINQDLIVKLKAANLQKDSTTAIAKQLKAMQDQYNRAGINADEKAKLAPQLQTLAALYQKENAKFESLADVAWKSSDKSKLAEDVGAVRVAQAELTPGSKNIKNQFTHPLLMIG